MEGRRWDDFLMGQSLSFKIYYVALYLCMEEVWSIDRNSHTDFNELLSEMDPLDDHCLGLSADPAYAWDFRHGFRRKFHQDECDLQGGYEYSLKYLKTLEWADGYREEILKRIPDANGFAHYVDEALKRKDEILAKTI